MVLDNAAFMRAQVAHGRIRGIDARQARNMPGVAAIYTMADFAAIAQGPMPPMAPHPLLKTPITYHPLAVVEVCHVGEAIAIVLADTRQQAEDAANAIDLDVEDLPSIADPLAALADDPPKVHSGRNSNLIGALRGGFAMWKPCLPRRITSSRGPSRYIAAAAILWNAAVSSLRPTLSPMASPSTRRRNRPTWCGAILRNILSAMNPPCE